MIQLFRKPKDIHHRLEKSRKKLASKILNQPENHWIRYNQVFWSFLLRTISLLPIQVLDKLAKQKIVILVRKDPFAQVTNTRGSKTFVLSLEPSFFELLERHEWRQAASCLLHEFGHIYLDHHQRKLASIHAEEEADRFVAQIDLGDSLTQFLKRQSNHPDLSSRSKDMIHRRIQKLTFYRLSQNI